ncbi:putative glutamine-scyllo-inositol transaminase [Candidatus Kuenenia stuttgartiensis]|uniref:Putative glutamine-scyllo-inositol transaminase n=1 Tax=Kuenenia stuttgartiensis TaxID=174633 RepID=A0A6G7GJS5_KUEST|nr:UDP-4-amino-4,6-dideoxy-N-acetyl-beta-L-altrosamine transaminase [Candidatus Kuenenia stuttgartiensis]QII09612.1 putative glutamine-scyllo-inositol transaminase [Candidatus Kuenenia stuttgartiensis]
MKITEDTFQKGSIYLAEFPFTSFKSSKIRPVVVLFEEKRFNDVAVMAISSVTERENKANAILISPEDKDFIKTGLKKESLILTHRMATIKKSRLFYRLGYLMQKYSDEIDTALLRQLEIGHQINAIQKHIPYSRQAIDEKDIASVCFALRSDWLTQGPKIKEFEELLANYCGAKFAVAVSSGTAALHAAYFAAGISSGDEIITSPITFAATANAAIYMGARPVFVDVAPDTGNIDTRKIQSAITAKTKAIVPVHFGGHPSDMEQIHSIADKNRLIVIEDACHALGAQHKIKDNDGNEKWVKVGSCTHSDMAIFSFHPVKSITTGEGGAVLTNNEDFYKKMLMFRSHGITRTDFINEPHGEWYYEMQCMGYNYRMTDIHAALGISQLNKLDSFIRVRRNIRDIYNKEFAENPYFDLPVEKDYVNSSLHLYAVKLKGKYIGQKAKIFERLKEKGLGVQVHYIPVYFHPFYRKTGYDEGICPEAELFYKRQLSIPLHHGLSETDALRLTKIVVEAFQVTPFIIKKIM